MDRQTIVEQAKSALKHNPYAGFTEQAPHLRTLLDNLPPRSVNTPAVQEVLCGGGRRTDSQSILEALERNWMGQHPPGSHDGAVHLELGEERGRLVITFHLFLWGKSGQVRRFEIARIAVDEFAYWDRGS